MALEIERVQHPLSRPIDSGWTSAWVFGYGRTL